MLRVCSKVASNQPASKHLVVSKYAPTIDTVVLTVIRKRFLPVARVGWVNGAIRILAPECDEV